MSTPFLGGKEEIYAAAEVYAAEHAHHESRGDEDFSAVIRATEEMAGLEA